MFALLAVEILADRDQHTLMLFAATFLVGSLVFGRQALAIRENRIMVEHERTSLISSLSHELRTPLTSLVGFLSVLDDDGDLLTASERVDIIATTRQQADYMGRMVTDLVMLARDDLDSVEIKIRADVLSEIIERSIVSADIPRKNLTVDVNEQLLVSVDHDRIQQVLVNLLTNAERYGSGRITLSASAQGDDLFLSVHDDGAGVPKKHQITMWERFERAHYRFNASIPGSGIGLAIVESLVKAHKGRVTYRDSELLGGACFMIELPGAVLPHAPAVRESVDSPQMAAGSIHTRAAS
jgi:signal transduction histidine kinase